MKPKKPNVNLSLLIQKVEDGNQARFARAINRSPGVVSQWLSGDKTPSLSSFWAIYDVYGSGFTPSKFHEHIGLGTAPGSVRDAVNVSTLRSEIEELRTSINAISSRIRNLEDQQRIK